MLNRFRPMRRLPFSALAAAVLSAGCSDLTKVEAPDVVQRPQLTNANGAITFFNGLVQRFYYTFNSSIALTGGTWADEFSSAGVTNYADPRQYTEGAALTLVGIYGGSPVSPGVQPTRIHALQTIGVLEQSLPAQRWRIGESFGFLAYTEAFLAELFCSGVPLSSINADFTPNLGQPMTTAQIYERALADFDSAIAYSTDSARILNMARVGRARVLLDQGKFAEAAAAAAPVPTSFSFLTEHSAAVNPNALFFTTNSTTIADKKGGNGLDYLSSNDPRIPRVFVAKGVDPAIDVYRMGVITSQASSSILASGIEARLIDAEAKLQAGDVTGWLAALNALRAGTAGLSPLTDPGTADARVNLLFRERAFWMFGNGHRAADMRRLLRQYGRALTTVYPVGPYKYGGSFLEESTIPFDYTETLNNPNLGGKQCLDRKP